MIGFVVEVEGLRDMRREVRRLTSALDDVLERAVAATARAVAAEAKRVHAYTDRTGHLTRSIAAQEPFGKFSDDTLEGAVTATARYASYIEDGTTRGIRPYRYLATAWFMQRDETEGRMGDALDDAVRRAGL